MPRDDDFDLDNLSLDEDLNSLDSSSTADAYGVWVKAGPEEVPSEDALPPGDSFESVSPSGNLASGGFDEISLDDFVSFQEDDASLDGHDESPAVKPSELNSEQDVQEEFLDIDIDIEDEISDEELEILDKTQVKKPTTQDGTGAEEIDISEFTDFGEEVSSDEFLGTSPDEPASASAPTQELEPWELAAQAGPPPGSAEDWDIPDVDLSSLEADVTSVDEAPSEQGAPEEELETEGNFEEEIFEEENSSELSEFEKSFDEVLGSEEKDFNLDLPPQEPDMAAIHSLEQDLTSGIRPSGQTENLLMKIEQELSSIRSELSTLKSELTGLKIQEQESGEPSVAEGGKGFFSDDDDEVIALTGDELDNILFNADITEEIQEDAGEAPDMDLLEARTDVDLFSGTSLEEVPTQDADLPETALNAPLPGGDDEGLELEGLELESLDSSVSLPEFEAESPQLEDTDPQSFFDAPLESDSEETLEVPFDDDELELEASEEQEAVPVVSAPAEPPAAPATPEPEVRPSSPAPGKTELSDTLKTELRGVLAYMDKLLSSLPDEKIQEFAESEHFEVYKKLFEELGLVE